jgi:hypothetical protein
MQKLLRLIKLKAWRDENTAYKMEAEVKRKPKGKPAVKCVWRVQVKTL